ncbi:DUF1799 domain-containing protein [Pseudomonas syringae]|uniref:DUF1799 domain-containing protein n=1 Tax=Pseudomonas syringae TaxID=317 RepID=UPI0007EE6755|nr:DUF1799 domain-containing protein [Pseudomonas syringae]OBS35867.1 hypothetical protein A9K81_05600 [Pseudomonas syringae pv. syringae]
MTLADIPVEEVEVWPDSWKAFRLFESLSTQWRTGPGGASGLDYSAIPATAHMVGLKRHELPGIFSDLRTLEVEALLVMSESK